MTIEKNGAEYLVTIDEQRFVGKFVDDRIKIDSPLGDIKYSHESDQLYLAGKEFTRATQLKEAAERAWKEREAISGVWYKEEKDGAFVLGSYLVIDALHGLELREYDKSAGRFENMAFSNGKITGSYVTIGDAEHSAPIELSRTDHSKLVSVSGDVKETFSKLEIFDCLEGTWESESLQIVIIRSAFAYRVYIKQNETIDTLSCTIQGGKLIFPGRENDYYKMQIPTIECFGEQKLTYTTGADRIELERTDGRKGTSSCDDAGNYFPELKSGSARQFRIRHWNNSRMNEGTLSMTVTDTYTEDGQDCSTLFYEYPEYLKSIKETLHICQTNQGILLKENKLSRQVNYGLRCPIKAGAAWVHHSQSGVVINVIHEIDIPNAYQNAKGIDIITITDYLSFGHVLWAEKHGSVQEEYWYENGATLALDLSGESEITPPVPTKCTGVAGRIVIVKGSNVRLRQQPDTSVDNIITMLDNDVKLDYVSTQDVKGVNWFKVCYNNQEGWISSEFSSLQSVN